MSEKCEQKSYFFLSEMDDTTDRKDSTISIYEYDFGVRHVQVGLIFSMVVVMYIISMAPSTAIVAMTDNSTSTNPDIPTFNNWNYQSFILFSYYLGYASTQLTGAPLARKYGFKWIMVISMVLAAITSLSIPFLTVKFGSIGFMGCYFFQGVCQGCVIPMLPIFISIWVPIPQRTSFGTFIFSSKTLGTVVTTEVTGLLARSWWGWPSAFYLDGILGLTWSIAMAFLGSDSPESHSSITESEVKLIRRGQIVNTQDVPWKDIVRSKATWATWIAHLGIMLTVRLSALEAPTYINRVLNFSVLTSSNVISLSLVIAYCNTYLIGFGSQYLIRRRILSIGSTRKLCNSIAAYGSAICLLVLSALYVERYDSLFMVMPLFICLNVSYAGYNINYNDLSHNFCSHIYGLGGFVSTLFSWIPPVLVQIIVTDQTNAKQWGIVFTIAAFMVSITNTVFIFGGSGEIQHYDHANEDEGSEKSSLLDNCKFPKQMNGKEKCDPMVSHQ